jgi:hypothetical protein
VVAPYTVIVECKTLFDAKSPAHGENIVRVSALVIPLLLLLAWSAGPSSGQGKDEIVFEEGKLIKVTDTKVFVDLKKMENGKSGKQARFIRPESRFTLEGRDVKPRDLVAGLEIRMQVKGKDVLFLEAKCPK